MRDDIGPLVLDRPFNLPPLDPVSPNRIGFVVEHHQLHLR